MDQDDPVLPIDPDLAPAGPARPTDQDPPGARWPRVRRTNPSVLVVISLGGMVGASARYGVARWLPVHPGGFPWATFWTNLTGSFLLGFVLVALIERFPTSRHLRPFVATGVLGAFTTMSIYQVETALLLDQGHIATALLYGIGSVVAGIAAAYAGLRAGRLTQPASHLQARGDR